MRRTILGLLAMTASVAVAQPAIYQNQTLRIPQGAVTLGEETAYYENIELQDDGSGNFTVTAAEPRSLVSVDSVMVNVMESLPVQVSLTIEGNKSVPCVDLLTPAVSYADGHFTVALAESQLGPAETCIAVLDPFSTTIDLDVAELPAGSYSVSVNGVSANFTL